MERPLPPFTDEQNEVKEEHNLSKITNAVCREEKNIFLSPALVPQLWPCDETDQREINKRQQTETYAPVHRPTYTREHPTMSHPDGWVDLDSRTILDHPKESGLLGGGGKLWESDQKKWGWGVRGV